MEKKMVTFVVFLATLCLSSIVWGDQIKLKDGRVLEGKILKEKDKEIHIRLKWGVLKVKKSKIAEIIKKKTPREEYRSRYNKLAYNDAEGYYQLGLFAEKKDLQEEAQRCFKKAVQINPHHKGARSKLGYVFYQGRWILKKNLPQGSEGSDSSSSSSGKKAEKEKKARDNFAPPKNVSKVALKYIEKGDEIYREAKKDPENTRKKIKKAIFYFKAATNLAYRYAVPHYKLGILYQWTREFRKARSALQRALKLNPKFHEAMVELGDTYAWMSDYEKAIETYGKAIDTYEKYIPAYRSRARLYCRMRKFKKAKKDLEKVLEINKFDIGSRRILKLVNRELKGVAWKKTYTIKSKHYVVYTNVSEEYAKKTSHHAELIYLIYSKIFPKLKKRKALFPVYVYKTRKGYLAAGSPRGSAGYFHPLLQKLVFYKQRDLDNTLTVLYHEGFHQYVHYYAPYVPSWFNEGNGDFFGGCRVVKGKMQIKPNRWRLGKIKNAIKKDKHLKLTKLMQMSKRQMYSGDRGLHYAQAWSIVYYLWMGKEGQYRPLIKSYFNLIRSGYGRIEAYKKAFGPVDMDQMEREWKKYVLKLKNK